MTLHAARSARRIVIIYLVFGLAWIFLSDLAALWLAGDAMEWQFSQTFKGSAFVVITGALLYALIGKAFGNLALAERENARINRLYRMLSASNHAVVHAASRDEAIRKALDVITQTGGYRLAWVGFVIPADERKRIRIAAAAGATAALEGQEFTWDNSPQGQSPSGRAIKSCRPATCHDTARDPSFVFWRDMAARAGVRAMVGLPLVVEGEITGALTVGADSVDVFDDEEMEILQEVSSDLAHIIENLKITEARKTAERGLARSEARWRSLVSQAPDFILTVNRGEIITFINHSAPGAPPPERIVGMNVYGYLPPDQRGTVRDALANAFERGQPTTYEAKVNVPGVGEQWYLSICGPVVVDGVVESAMLMAHDITARKERERKLFEAEQKLETLVNSIDDIVFIVDRQGRYTSLHGRWFDRYETDAQAYLGKHAGDLFGARYAETHTAAYRRALEGEYVIFESIVTIGGHKRFFQTSLSPTYDKAGAVTGAVGIGRDITKIKTAEENIIKLSGAVEQSPVSVVITDVKGDIEYVNPKFLAVSGYTAEEVTGQNPRILKSGDTPPEVYKELWETITAGGAWRGEFLNKKKNGEYFWEMASISPIRDSQGNITHFLGVKEDITERKSYESSLRASNEMLTKTLNEMVRLQTSLIRTEKLASLGALSAGVAHEIKNPLNIIATTVQLLEMEAQLPEESRAQFATILEQVQRAARITENLRDFARERRPEIRAVNLQALLDKTLSLVRYEMGLENIKAVTDFPEDPITLMADADQLAQVFLNIISNARDSMNERQAAEPYDQLAAKGWEGVLRITVRRRDGRVVIEFHDQGNGIPQEAMDKLFDPFFTTKPEGKGTGLGLSISHSIIENHGGSIRASSMPGEGSTFTILLPLEEGSPGATDILERR